ncbi:hypothetical protein ACFL6C_05635 [Myxococcota bacterium]
MHELFWPYGSKQLPWWLIEQQRICYQDTVHHKPGAGMILRGIITASLLLVGCKDRNREDHPLAAGPPAPEITSMEGMTAPAPVELHGRLIPNNNPVKDDILLRFELTATQRIFVWDSKYSKGYRSWTFDVVTPTGDNVILQRAAQNAWDKNAPHVVLIDAAHPYDLVGWGTAHGEWVGEHYYFSLKKLGLDTSERGDYRITGRFSQMGEQPDDESHDPSRIMWSGTVTTATIKHTL